MVAHSKPYVVIVALAGLSPGVVDAVGAARRIRLDPVVVTDRERAAALGAALDGAGFSDVRIVEVRRRPLDGVRRQVRTMIRRPPRAIARRIRRLLTVVARLFGRWGSIGKSLDAVGRGVEDIAAAGSDRLSGDFVEPAIAVLGSGLSRLRQSRGVMRAVTEHVRSGRVVGIVCLDGPSLLPGWLVGRRFKVLPVVTSFPIDWDESVAAQLAAMEAGSKW